MKRMQKRLFTLSGLFMVLAQVFVMAFSGIAAIAITQDETTKNLFEVSGSSATMGYELVDNETIKWTISLNKGGHDSPTRFMVDLQAGDSSIVPGEVHSTNSGMIFGSSNGNEYIQGGISEAESGSANGQTTITFETSRDISNLVVTPKLITIPIVSDVVATAVTDEESAESQPVVENEPVNLLENVSEINFEIPAVVEEAVEESTSVDSEAAVIDDETVVSESEVVEEATENTEDENTATESSDILEETGDKSTGIEDPVGRAQYRGFVSLTGVQLLADPLDPFEYTTDAEGTYPTHKSSSYVRPGEEIATSDDIRNYNYGSTTGKNDTIDIFNTSAGVLNIETGYHEYGSDATGRINTKKTVSPTSDSNIFQVQLDTIGDAIKTSEKADIVLVLDKSASMRQEEGGSTRWSQLKSAVTRFANDLLADTGADIQIGLVGFYSEGNTSIAEVATFGASEFTSSATAVTDHGLVAETPLQNRGTPTFIGVDAGVNLLHNGTDARSNAQKIMITITDGEPTYRPKSNYTFSDIESTTVTESNIKRYSTTLTNGDGRDDESTANITHINNVYTAYPNVATDTKPATSFYSVGFHTGSTANDVVSKLGREGAYAASDVTSLVTALQNAVAGLLNTIANATLTDPMSEYVTLDVSSVTTTGLYLNNGVLSIANAGGDFTSGFQVSPEGNQITVSNVTLGSDTNGRQGYRITYKVTLNTDQQDGAFYPVNATTYLANGEKGNHYYAIPSVRMAPAPVPVTFTKTNVGGDLLAGAQFTLTAIDDSTKVYTSNVTNETGVVRFTEVIPGNYTLTETQTPAGHTGMEPVNVRVDLKGKITFTDGTDLTTVTNTLKQIDISLNKVGPDGNALAGATFILQDSTGNELDLKSTETVGLHERADVAPGVYKVIEKTAPAGYEILGEIGTLTIDKYGTATFTKVDGSNQTITVKQTENEKIEINLSEVKNELKGFDLTVFKEDDAQNALIGAEFTLTGPDDYEEIIASSETTPVSTFIFKNLKSGTYTLTETITPEGYVGLANSITIEISSLGEVTVTGASATSSLNEVGNNTISFTVTNKKKVPLPATGGAGTMLFVTIGVLALIATALYFLQRKDREVA